MAETKKSTPNALRTGETKNSCCASTKKKAPERPPKKPSGNLPKR